MQKELQEIDFYFTMTPIFYFSRFCGLWTYGMKRTSPAIGTGPLIYYFSLFSVYIYFFWINFDKEFWTLKYGPVAGSEIQTYGTWSQVLSGLLIGMISLFVSLLTHKKQWKFLETIDQVDKTLTKDFSIITPKKITRTIAWGVIVFINIMLCLLVSITYFVFETLQIPSLMLCASMALANLPYASIIVQFSFAANAIERRFFYINNIFRQLASNDIPKVFDLCSKNQKNERQTATISFQEIYSIYGGYHARKNILVNSSKGYNIKNEFNREIKMLTAQLEKREEKFIEQFQRKDLIEVQEYKITKLSNVESTLEHLTKLVDLHDDLLDCISLQNQILSFQILLIIAQIFVFGVITFFSLYRTTINPHSNILAISNIFWILLYSLILYIIMNFASDCVYEGKFTGTAVHKVINKLSNYQAVDARVIEKLSIISHQLTMRVPDITCGLFSFDWELLFSIISATCIYLIFLMQFDEASVPSATNSSGIVA